MQLMNAHEIHKYLASTNPHWKHTPPLHPGQKLADVFGHKAQFFDGFSHLHSLMTGRDKMTISALISDNFEEDFEDNTNHRYRLETISLTLLDVRHDLQEIRRLIASTSAQYWHVDPDEWPEAKKYYVVRSALLGIGGAPIFIFPYAEFAADGWNVFGDKFLNLDVIVFCH